MAKCEQTNDHCMFKYGVDIAFSYHRPFHCLGCSNGSPMTSVAGSVQVGRHQGMDVEHAQAMAGMLCQARDYGS